MWYWLVPLWTLIAIFVFMAGGSRSVTRSIVYPGGDSFDAQESVQLINGTITGIRQFQWNGRHLTGMAETDHEWLPGENIAECPLRQWSGKIHRIAAANCQCGYYAYFINARYSHLNPVRGLIEGYGRVTIGSKGFRCQKARIVAFIGVPFVTAKKRAIRKVYPEVPWYPLRALATWRHPLSAPPHHTERDDDDGRSRDADTDRPIPGQ